MKRVAFFPVRLDVLTAACVLCAGIAASVHAEDRALIVGVGEYQIAGANLTGIDKDVAMMRDVARMMGFRDSQVKVLENQSATLRGITSAFESWLIDGVGPSDRALFYFSGHGSQMRDQPPLDEPDGLDEFLVPYDFAAANGVPRNALVDDALGVLLARIKSSRVLVFIDACHSGSSTKALVAQEKFLSYPGMPGPKALPGARPSAKRGFVDAAAVKGPLNYVALSAAGDEEKALPSPAGSLFTLGVYKAVRDAVQARRPVSIAEIKAVATATIREKATADRKPVHTPQLTGGGTLVSENLLAIGVTPIKPPVPPLPPASAGLWAAFEAVADRVAPDRRIRVTTERREYRSGDQLALTITVPADGFLNVLNVGDGESKAVVLFPNRLHVENRVRGGEQVTVPAAASKFVMKASLPSGRAEQRNLLVVVVTDDELNAFKLGDGNAFLRELSSDTARSFAVTAVNREYRAGKAITVIRQ